MIEPEGVVHPIKDETAAHAVASAWRPALREVVSAFVHGDYALQKGVAFVEPVPSSTADHIKSYLESYGETLTELSEETWETSVSQWMSTHWDVLVDLWTVESGRSDMVLHARVLEVGESFRIEIYLVYVP